MNREARRTLAADTLRILARGRYEAPSGQTVQLRYLVEQAARGTQLYTPSEPPPPAQAMSRRTRFEVFNETTLAGAHVLAQGGNRVSALNFASAKNPGGGFRSGSEAQEESLARASGLFPCVDGSPFYSFHREQADPRYSDRAIYSPDVPVFRSYDGVLLDAPWACSFVTAAAVNRKAARVSDAEARSLMARRISFVLDVMAAQGHDTIVLGAWGCGVFRNAPEDVAALFHEALVGTHRGVFARVRFSVLDGSKRGPHSAFVHRFG